MVKPTSGVDERMRQGGVDSWLAWDFVPAERASLTPHNHLGLQSHRELDDSVQDSIQPGHLVHIHEVPVPEGEIYSGAVASGK